MHYNQLKSNKSLTCSNLTLLLSIYGPGSHILGRKGEKFIWFMSKEIHEDNWLWVRICSQRFAYALLQLIKVDQKILGFIMFNEINMTHEVLTLEFKFLDQYLELYISSKILSYNHLMHVSRTKLGFHFRV